MASGSPTSNFMLLQPCNAKSDLSASRYSSQWAMRRGASLHTRSGAMPAFRSDRPPRKCFFSPTRITSPARPDTTYKERPCVAKGARSGPRSPVSPQRLTGPLCGPFATQGRSYRYSASQNTTRYLWERASPRRGQHRFNGWKPTPPSAATPHAAHCCAMATADAPGLAE